MENVPTQDHDVNEVHAQLQDRGSQILENVDRDQASNRRRRHARGGHLTNPRDRLFHALFIKLGLVYARLVPKKLRIVLELLVLLKVDCLGVRFLS